MPPDRCPLCSILSALKSWRARRDQARTALSQAREEPAQSHGPQSEIRRMRPEKIEPWLRTRRQEAEDEGWRRLNSPEDLTNAIPDDWLRTRRRH